MKNILLSFVLILASILAGCSPAANAPEEMMDKSAEPTATMMEKSEAQMMKTEELSEMAETPDALMNEKPKDMMEDDKLAATPPAEMGMDREGEMMTPAFFEAALTDAASGQTFQIADYKGKVVLVETLAMWCSSCLRQQKQVQALHELLGERDDFVSLGLDIDPNENLGDLKGYITSQGFDWLYAVAPVEVAREIGQLYGDQFLNPPSTPMFIIDRHGAVHPLPFGVKSAEDLQKALEPFLNEDM